MCKYCERPARDIQVKGGGRYGRARVVGFLDDFMEYLRGRAKAIEGDKS